MKKVIALEPLEIVDMKIGSYREEFENGYGFVQLAFLVFETSYYKLEKRYNLRLKIYFS